MAINGHHSASAQTDIWLTPPEIIKDLGPFDLDPCAAENSPCDTAKTHYTENGLLLPWHGFVWCNPPYTRELIGAFMQRCAMHNNGLAMTFARTETEWFFAYVWPVATAILFVEGRIHFYKPDGTRAKGNCGGPSVIIAYGSDARSRLKASSVKGKFIELKHT